MFCAVERPMCVVTDVTFSYREPPSKSKKTVAEIRKISARCCGNFFLTNIITE